MKKKREQDILNKLQNLEFRRSEIKVIDHLTDSEEKFMLTHLIPKEQWTKFNTLFIRKNEKNNDDRSKLETYLTLT